MGQISQGHVVQGLSDDIRLDITAWTFILVKKKNAEFRNWIVPEIKDSRELSAHMVQHVN